MGYSTAFKIEISGEGRDVSSTTALLKAIQIAKCLNHEIKVTIINYNHAEDKRFEIPIQARPDSNWLDLEQIYRLKFDVEEGKLKNK